MRYKSYSTIYLFAVLLFNSCEKKVRESVGQKPNVIVIMTDDQGYGDVAAHGNLVIKTPNLDRLYNESVRFTDFHVNPFCAPTRAALMTGRMSDRTHVRSTVYARNYLNKEETTMADFFKVSGYRTGHFGKWHLGQNYPYRPMDRGFESWVGHGDGGTGSSSDYWGNDKMNDHYYKNGKWSQFNGYGNDVFFNETLKFIEKNKKTPFFVYLATNIPHAPWNVLEEYYEEYNEVDGTKYKDWNKKKDFLSTITHFDQNLGKLRAYLRKNGLEKNTILIFLTDNGTSGGSTIFNAGMKGRKGSMYEGGHRVPFYLHWQDGGLDKGIDIKEFTAHIDLLPTLINLCDLKTPKRGHFKFDGQDLTPLLFKKKDVLKERYLIMHQQNALEIPVKGKNSLVATKKWRFINGKELYDIKADPSQKNNLIDEYPNVVKNLNKEYNAFWKSIAMEQNPYPLPIIGSGYDDETWLTPDSWIRDNEKLSTWDQSQVVVGVNGAGFWSVEISKKERYQFDVRRWPKELNCSLNSSLLESKISDVLRRGEKVDDYGYGKRFAKGGNSIKRPLITKVGLKVGDVYIEKEVKIDAVNALFEMELNTSSTHIQAWLIDSNNEKQGAYYVYAKLKKKISIKNEI